MSWGAKSNPVVAEHEAELARLRGEITFLKDQLGALKKANLRLYDETTKWDAERDALQALVNEVMVERDILLVALREIAIWESTHPGNIARAAIAQIEGERTLETM